MTLSLVRCRMCHDATRIPSGLLCPLCQPPPKFDLDQMEADMDSAELPR